MREPVPSIVVMGVSGTGKSTVAEELSQRLGLGMVEGDDHHPQANVDKMASGVPSTTTTAGRGCSSSRQSCARARPRS